MAANGRLANSELSPIPGGRLRHDAARAWNDGPRRAGLRPLGPDSSYRTFDRQVFWRNHWCSLGKCGNAAVPGTSNHGVGLAVDLAEPWMRQWIDRHGSAFGWRKVEALNEWWHVNYVGGYKPKPSPLRFLGRVRRRASATLLKRRQRRADEARTGKGPRWRRANRLVKRSYRKVRRLYKRAHGRSARVLKRVLKDRDGRL